MDEFAALVTSLGEWTLAHLPPVKELTVHLDSRDKTAHVTIRLAQDSWQNRDRAVDVMLDVRETFFDDVSLTYDFGGARSDALARAEGKSVLTFA